MSDRRLVTASVVAVLQGAATFPVGDGRAPDEVSGRPWAIVYSIDGGRLLDDNLGAREHSTDLVYQVTSIGRRRDQAEWAADLCRRTMLARTPAGAFQVVWPAVAAGVVVVDRQLLGPVGGVKSDGNPPHDVHSTTERYIVRLVPT